MNAALATCGAQLLGLVALAVLANGSRAAQPDSTPLQIDLEPATQLSSVQVLDSKIEAPNNNFYAYWLDDETVIFNAQTDETWEHWTPLRQVPVIRIATWNVTTNEVRYFEEMSSYLCVWRGRVAFRTYPKTSAGERVRREGQYVEEFRFGTMAADFRALHVDRSIPPEMRVDDLSCQPDSGLPPIPEWIISKGWWYNRLPEQFGLKIDLPGEPSGTRSTPPIVCPYGSSGPEDCVSLPLPGRLSYFSHYVEHLDSMLVEGPGHGNQVLWTALVQRSRVASSQTINRDQRGSLPLGALFTRVGLVRVLPNSGSPSLVGNGGVWAWNKGNPKRLAVLAAYSSASGQRAVSPSGCLVAFSGSDRPTRAARTVRVTRLCARE